MDIEIKTSVARVGELGTEWVTIIINQDDLIELAKVKALENVDPQDYNKAECEAIYSVQTTR